MVAQPLPEATIWSHASHEGEFLTAQRDVWAVPLMVPEKLHKVAQGCSRYTCRR